MRWKVFVSDRAEARFVEKYRAALGISMPGDGTPLGLRRISMPHVSASSRINSGGESASTGQQHFC